MTLEQQIDFGAIHSVADQRGGQPVDQALAGVREWLRQRHLIALDRDRITFALSCIETGAENIRRGRVELGLKGISEGTEFIRTRVTEARDAV